jgi:hypothetical protein
VTNGGLAKWEDSAGTASGQTALIIRREVVTQKGSGRRGVIGQHLSAVTADGDVNAAYPAFVVDDRALAKESIQWSFATVESPPLVLRRQSLDARLIHGAG